MRFMAIFLNSTHQFELISFILVALVISRDLVVVPGHEGGRFCLGLGVGLSLRGVGQMLGGLPPFSFLSFFYYMHRTILFYISKGECWSLNIICLAGLPSFDIRFVYFIAHMG